MEEKLSLTEVYSATNPFNRVTYSTKKKKNQKPQTVFQTKLILKTLRNRKE